MKYQPQIYPSAESCGSWWGSLAHWDYLHRCVRPENHDGACACPCGKKASNDTVSYPKKTEN